MLLIQRAGLPPARPPHSVPSGEVTMADFIRNVNRALYVSSPPREAKLNATPEHSSQLFLHSFAFRVTIAVRRKREAHVVWGC